MEEFIGTLWHRLVTRAARRDCPQARVSLVELEAMAGPLLRAFGGDPALRIAPAGQHRHGARRRLAERIAGSGERSALASLDLATLRLPESLALFPSRALNRELYLWLIALAGQAGTVPGGDWLGYNLAATRAVLARWPGLAPRYRRLLAAHLAQRPDPRRLPGDEAAQERALRAALAAPHDVHRLPPARRPPQPVPLWLRPADAADPASQPPASTAVSGDSARARAALRQRKQGRYETAPENDAPLLLPFRAESVLSWAEYVRVSRATDEDEPDAAAAREMDSLTLTRDGTAARHTLRFDLDLPAPAQDDTPLGPGLTFPEYDWRRRQLLPDQVRVQPVLADQAIARTLPDALAPTARRLRAQFAALAPQRRWQRGLADGPELDLDALVRYQVERAAGALLPEPAVYAAPLRSRRDLACLVLADLSLSTEAHVDDQHRVIDVVRDSLLLLGEALDASGDDFALFGFSSLKRTQVRVHPLKEFDAPYDDGVRGRVSAIRPGYYTRMGAALRFATRLLGERDNALRLLLLLTDGKPHDIDHYDGRFAVEDTAAAVREARRAGLHPFCVTIDQEAAHYLPHLFGPQGYTLIRRPQELPHRLPALYAQWRA